MLAFESYSKTSFEIIIKERVRAFLFKKMALQVPRFILEHNVDDKGQSAPRLKKGDRATFEAFIDEEKWLGECVKRIDPTSAEGKAHRKKIIKKQKAHSEMATAKALLDDYQRLKDFYGHI